MADIDDDLWGPAPEVEPAQEVPSYDEPDYSGFNPEDDSLYENPSTEEPKPSQSDKKADMTSNYLDRLLRERGVDRSRVRIENEDGDIEEWNFDDLDDATKYGILSEQESTISDEEIETLNFLRSNKMNLRDFAEYQKRQAIEEYLSQNQDVTYTVDQVNDDDLFRFDLSEQMPDLTDEEIEDQLARAKESPSYFEKKVGALRAEYKKLEDEQEQAKAAEAQRQSEAQFNQLAYSLVNAARETTEMDGMILDDDDREEVLSFLLDRDANGQTQFYKMFENPEALFKIAWRALKGDEANAAKESYFKSEIAKARRSAKSSNLPAPARTVRRASKKSSDPDDDMYGLNSVFKS